SGPLDLDGALPDCELVVLKPLLPPDGFGRDVLNPLLPPDGIERDVLIPLLPMGGCGVLMLVVDGFRFGAPTAPLLPLLPTARNPPPMPSPLRRSTAELRAVLEPLLPALAGCRRTTGGFCFCEGLSLSRSSLGFPT